MNDLIERLKFHGRHATENQSDCARRKNAEREEAVQALQASQAREEGLREALAQIGHHAHDNGLTWTEERARQALKDTQ